MSERTVPASASALMREAAPNPQPGRPPCSRIALVGPPNCGKTSLFNLLTGSRQKVANYPGVTVDFKEGTTLSAAGRPVAVVDLPGTYALEPLTPDEAVTQRVLDGTSRGIAPPDLVVCVADSTQLRLGLRLALDLKRRQVPFVLALNMSDVAHRRGLRLDIEALEDALQTQVVETVGVRSGGARELLALLDAPAVQPRPDTPGARPAAEAPAGDAPASDLAAVDRLLSKVLLDPGKPPQLDDRIDAVLLHPVAGMLILALTLFLLFQAVFSWARAPMEELQTLINAAAELLRGALPEGPLRGLLIDGALAGVGSVVVFLPQILILFFFILVLEDSGYLPRAALMLDRLMAGVGLSGRAFIPLLSSFACAIPGVMATRTIRNPRERALTMILAPLMTCSARLPVYTLIIGAFVPDRMLGGLFNLRGATLFALYVAGIVSAMAVAWIFKLSRRGAEAGFFVLELPAYRLPLARNILISLYERARAFLIRAGTLIFAMMVVLWFLTQYPQPEAGASGPAIMYSVAGRLGTLLQPLFAPLGFNWQIVVALIPGLAAREVAVAALGTVYAVAGSAEQTDTLGPVLAAHWSMATAFALLAWYVYAPQCLATIAVIRRESGGWRWPLAAVAYLFGLAYIAAFAVYRLTLAFSGG